MNPFHSDNQPVRGAYPSWGGVRCHAGHGRTSSPMAIRVGLALLLVLFAAPGGRGHRQRHDRDGGERDLEKTAPPSSSYSSSKIPSFTYRKRVFQASF